MHLPGSSWGQGQEAGSHPAGPQGGAKCPLGDCQILQQLILVGHVLWPQMEAPPGHSHRPPPGYWGAVSHLCHSACSPALRTALPCGGAPLTAPGAPLPFSSCWRSRVALVCPRAGHPSNPASPSTSAAGGPAPGSLSDQSTGPAGPCTGSGIFPGQVA